MFLAEVVFLLQQTVDVQSLKTKLLKEKKKLRSEKSILLTTFPSIEDQKTMQPKCDAKKQSTYNFKHHYLKKLK